VAQESAVCLTSDLSKRCFTQIASLLSRNHPLETRSNPLETIETTETTEGILMSKIAVLAKLTAAEGKRAEALAVLSAQVALVNGETGTEIYALHTDDGDDVTIWFYELYTDDAALAHHSGSEAMAALGPKLKGLMAARPEIKRLTPVTAKGLSVS
jgi:quinol monooxygenase YgiN